MLFLPFLYGINRNGAIVDKFVKSLIDFVGKIIGQNSFNI